MNLARVPFRGLLYTCYSIGSVTTFRPHAALPDGLILSGPAQPESAKKNFADPGVAGMACGPSLPYLRRVGFEPTTQ